MLRPARVGGLVACTQQGYIKLYLIVSCPWVSSMNGLVVKYIQRLFFWRQLEQLQEASVLGRFDSGKKCSTIFFFF